jgi:hypothetical protein
LSQAAVGYRGTGGCRAGGRPAHFLLDGWTVNHSNAYHGLPIRQLDLELATYFETGIAAARAQVGEAGAIREIPPTRQRQLIARDRRSQAADTTFHEKPADPGPGSGFTDQF